MKDAAGNTIPISDLDVYDTDNLSFVLTGQMERGWVLSYNLTSKLTKTSKNTQATVTVDSSDIILTNGDDLVYVSIESKGIDASVKKLKDVAVEEVVTIEDLKIEPSVGANMEAVVDEGDEITLKLNSGFEFANNDNNKITIKADGTTIKERRTPTEADEEQGKERFAARTAKQVRRPWKTSRRTGKETS